MHFQFVSDVCHYDFVLLCDLFGGAFSLPPVVNPICYDICQDITSVTGLISEDFADHMYEAFNESREKILEWFVKRGYVREMPAGKKHNSLYDATVIKGLYEGLNAYDDDMMQAF